MDYANITQSSISLHIPDQLSQGNFSNTDDFLKIMPPTEDNATKIPLKEKVLSVFPSLSSPRSESFVNMSTSNETSRPVSRPARRRKIVAAESDSEDSMMGATTSSQKDSCQTIGTSQQHSHSSSPSSASKLALSNPRVSTKKRQLPSSSDVSSSSETESDSSDSDGMNVKQHMKIHHITVHQLNKHFSGGVLDWSFQAEQQLLPGSFYRNTS